MASVKVYKIGFTCSEMRQCDWWCQCALMTLTPMHARWTVVTERFFHVVPSSPPSPSLSPSTVNNSLFLPVSPPFSCTTEPPATPPPSSSTCLLFFSSGGERANKQSNKCHFPVHMCGCLFQGVNNYILTRSPCSLPSLNTCVMCLFLTVFGGSRRLWPTHWCLSDKTAVTKDLAAE